MSRKIPLAKLHVFRQRLGIKDSDLLLIESLKDFFVSRKNEFALYFHDYFMEIPETRLIIEQEERPGYLRKAWAYWFEALFSRGLDEPFLIYLWQVGMKHVEISLDKRLSNMGFSVVRQFCQRLILEELPAERATEAVAVIDRLIDFCILVETDAYLETTTHCDLEIIRGVADRIRNPVTVIGGNISRLMKHADPADPAYPVYEFIFAQSAKCERMVRDIRTYMDIFERETEPVRVSLEQLLSEVLEVLAKTGRYKMPPLKKDIGEGASDILADERDMKALFNHVLENALEALGEENPLIVISSRMDEERAHSLTIEIFNTGIPVKQEDLEKLFSPFFSTKPSGTGFGLGIARQASRRNLGRLHLEPVGQEGTRAVITLPRYEQNPA
jgi:signal transduction histidine kinase